MDSHQVEAIAEAFETIRDAARYRWLVARLQAAYDGDTNDDFDALTVFCSMQWGHRGQRRVEAYITWTDVRDEPLDLGAAIDAAMQMTPNGGVQAAPRSGVEPVTES